MTDTCGLTFCEPFAKWDHDSQCWKTSAATCLWALTLSSLTLPAWGGLHDGELCEHPTPELHTSAPDYSSLPTPRTSDSNGAGGHGSGGPDLRTTISMLPTPRATDGTDAPANLTPSVEAICDGSAGRTPRLSEMAVGRMLPTPTSQAAKHGETPDTTANGYGSNLWDLPSLLPTPTTRDWKGQNQRGDDSCLPGALLPTPTAHPQKTASPEWGYPTLQDAALLIGATTPPQSDAGKPSSDDQPHRQLSLDELAHPA